MAQRGQGQEGATGREEGASASTGPAPDERFFCHACRRNVTNVTAVFQCPECGGGFLEKVAPDDEDSFEAEFNTSGEEVFNQLFGMLNAFGGQAAEGGRVGEGGGGGGGPHQQNPLQNFLGQLLQNLSGQGLHVQLDSTPRGGVLHIGAHGGQPGPQPQAGFFNFAPLLGEGLHGNIQDYAWGPGGLDEIVTNLLNQIEGGSPPLSRSQIDSLPQVPVTAEQVEQKVQCTTCMDEFKLGEVVKQLPCRHCFHKSCIDPWLERHNTCPICRKTIAEGKGVSPQEGSSGNGGSGSGSSGSSRGGNNPDRVQQVMDSIDELD